MPPKAGYLIDDQAPLAELWNAHMRWTGKDIANLIASHVYNQLGGVATGTARVVGGLAVTAGSGMQSDYTAGAAIHHDATVYTAVLAGENTVSPFGWQMVEAGASLTHDAAHATLTRVDLVCILSTIGTDRSESVQQDGGSTTPQDTRWGGQSSVVIVKGTAGAGVPATPTGYTKLAEASIPALAVAASSFTYTDSRVLVSAKVLRGAYYEVLSGTAADVELLRATDDNGDSISLEWDIIEHYPRWARVGPPSGDATTDLHPMVVPGSRSWSRSYPLSPIALATVGITLIAKDITGTNYAIINRTGNSTTAAFVLPLAGDSRGLEVTGINLRWATPVAWTATIDTQAWVVRHVDGTTGTATIITGTELLAMGTIKTIQNDAATMAATPVMDDGDYLVFEVDLGTSGGGVAGTLHLYSVEVTFKEGRA